MKFSVSSLGFVPDPERMSELSALFGIEIFVEWVPESYWTAHAPGIVASHPVSFSLHAPFQHVDISLEGDDERALAPVAEPLRLCRSFPVESYVIHTNGPLTVLPGQDEILRRQERILRRLRRLHRLCEEAGTELLVENLGFGNGRKHLYTEESFLDIFRQAPELKCIIDVGHAIVEGCDIGRFQRELGQRIRAYHHHDNEGLLDNHQRVGTARLDIPALMQGVRDHTPDANLVFEYADSWPVSAYEEDRTLLLSALD